MNLFEIYERLKKEGVPVLKITVKSDYPDPLADSIVCVSLINATQVLRVKPDESIILKSRSLEDGMRAVGEKVISDLKQQYAQISTPMPPQTAGVM